ncbi:ATP-binding cassette domain-containing protein [Natronorubrum sp. JWXQ-INN-674]|uniref:ATP-binding cassette domain-containing protein n=1 Tax=Natronorubrum halalkaliphilum TaxID=2691917 RepID=A0A6B0VPL1_9EURY|nr:ABC transporter ATP-binding protein [Natronorubrum halalkaliphilum]MXV63205.1 ATP-binding cassette domain-containing protein [Natronorubrum halalkaliphilum]
MNITITDVHKRYGDVVALDGPSFEVPTGSTFGVLGTNGAGKTTLFELLVGHDRPDEGSIEVGGLDVETAGHRVRERVGFLPEHSGFPPSMTGREVLSVHARIRGLSDRDARIEECLALVGLADAADRPVSGYSNGMGRRLGLASVLLSRPPVLVLDEPTAGLDPRGVTAFHRIIERIDRETDVTVVLSSHVLSEVERLCDEVVILQAGRLRAAGSVDDLRSSDERVTVALTPADHERESLLEAVQNRGNVTDTGDEIEVVCGREAAFDLLGSLEREHVERFEVHEPGLEAAFHEALSADEPTAAAEEVRP